MNNGISSRKPTEAEYRELVELLDTLAYYILEDEEERQADISTALEAATLVVFENLETQNPQCSGKTMLVIWADHSTNNFDVYRWNQDGELEEVEQMK